MGIVNDLIKEIYGPLIEKQYGLTMDQAADYLEWSDGHMPLIKFGNVLIESCGPLHWECPDADKFILPAPPNH